MLTSQEKEKIKDILSSGLGINRNINLAYFLTEIDDTAKKVNSLEFMLRDIQQNQKNLDRKFDMIINMLNKISNRIG